MNPEDWFNLVCLALGWAQGLWVGWYIWRRPQLSKYNANSTKDL